MCLLLLVCYLNELQNSRRNDKDSIFNIMLSMPIRTSRGVTDFIHHHSIYTDSCDTQTTPSPMVSVLGLNMGRRLHTDAKAKMRAPCPLLSSAS